MEVFSFLKFRRDSSPTDVRNQGPEADEEGSFFDLVFTAPDSDNRKLIRSRKFNKEDNNSRDVEINSSDNDEDSCKNSSKRDGLTRSNFLESPNKVFYKRKIKISHIESHSKNNLSPISLLRSPQKFKVLMLGFKKSRLDKETEANTAPMATIKHSRNVINKSSPREQSNRFTLKCEVEEFPISSLFTRDRSLRSQLDNERSEESPANYQSKVQKYLNLIKPLYIRVSKRYRVKTKFSDKFPAVSPFSSPATAPVCSPRKQVGEKQGSRAAVFREVCKSLVKSRSTSSAVGIMPVPVSRRDDSVLQQQDGIQSAILHCKRSYSSSSSQDYSMLSRSASNSSQEKSINLSRISAEEEKRSSI